jgi:hypothetical protein
VEWELDDVGSIFEVDEESRKNPQSAATLSLGLKRKPGFYLEKYVYRPGVIATLACVSTFIPTNEIGNQLALTFTVLLTLTSINYTAAESLPALPYSTELDRYHEACHYLVYSVIFHNVIFFLIDHKDPRIVDLVNWALQMLFQADCDSCKKAAAAASCTASSDHEPDCATTEMPAELAGVGTSSAAYMAADAAGALNSTWASGASVGAQRLSVALADGARAGADVRMANAAAAAAVATAAAVAATSPTRVVASGGDASRDEVCAALENAAAEAANAARRAAEEAAELRVELVGSKLRAAEAEYELESVRGKIRKLKEKMEQYGGDHLESAQRATQMEVKLAQSLQEAARLRAENSQLQEDVKGMIELKLQLSESLAQLVLT